jgi:ParB-like nuclease domain
MLHSLPLDQLLPAPYNPRVPLRPGDARFEKLRRSIEEFDLVQPLVWNRRTGHLVGGHQRLEVLRHLGRTEADCVVVDLPPEREKALNVALNNTGVGGEWDVERLIEVVEELHDLPDFDATLTGFDQQELNDLVLAPDPSPAPGWGLDDDEDDSDAVRVTLEVPRDRWDDVQPLLDDLLAAEPAVELHVRGSWLSS